MNRRAFITASAAAAAMPVAGVASLGLDPQTTMVEAVAGLIEAARRAAPEGSVIEQVHISPNSKVSDFIVATRPDGQEIAFYPGKRTNWIEI